MLAHFERKYGRKAIIYEMFSFFGKSAISFIMSIWLRTSQLNSNAKLRISMSIKKVKNDFMDSQVLIQFDVLSF